MSDLYALSSSERVAARSREHGMVSANIKPSTESVLVAKTVSLGLNRKPAKPAGVIVDMKGHALATDLLFDNLSRISLILKTRGGETKNE